MYRGMGGDILEGDTLVILVQELCWDCAIQNLVKDCCIGILNCRKHPCLVNHHLLR